MADPSTINAGTALQKYVLLAKGAKGRAAAQLVETVLDDPNIFVFGELIELPNISQLEHEDYGKDIWAQLNLMAYGTFVDFADGMSDIKALSPKRITKLKMLSIVAIAGEMKIIPYPYLMKKLQLENVRELEDMAIDCIHRGLFKGKLDQETNQLEIHYTIGRDVRPEDIGSHLSTIRQWASDCKDLMNVIEERMTMATVRKEEKAELTRNHEHSVEVERERVRKSIELASQLSGASSGMRRERERGNDMGMGWDHRGDYYSAEYHHEERNMRMKPRGYGSGSGVKQAMNSRGRIAR